MDAQLIQKHVSTTTVSRVRCVGVVALVALAGVAGYSVSVKMLTQPAQATLSTRDLARAHQVIPGEAFRAAHAGKTNELLNKHLAHLASGAVKPCEEFSQTELDVVQAQIKANVHPTLLELHAANKHPTQGAGWKDTRAVEGATIKESAILQLPQEMAELVRKEKACYDVAMHFTHNVPDASKRAMVKGTGIIIPLLPAAAAHETNARITMLADVGAGEKIFSGNCAACHAGGQNAVVPTHTLERDELQKFLTGGENEGAVVKQVTNGKNAMPAFGGPLSDADIKNVAAYVIQTANAGWD